MKILTFHAGEFWYKTFRKTLENVEDVHKENTVENAVVAFLQAEAEDETRESEIVNRTFRHLKWLAHENRLNTNNIVLHAFAHLSDSKSTPEFAQKVIEQVKEQLEKRNYNVEVTPFGYFFEFKVHVLGESLAKVFKSI